MSRRSGFSSALPLVFGLGVALGTVMPLRQWTGPLSALTTSPVSTPSPAPAMPDISAAWSRAGHPGIRHPVDVIRTIDGDTFEAQVHLWPGLDMTTKVRLRGIDAPELKASCAQESRMAGAAGEALRDLLGEGHVTIFNIGPDKYNGRVVADAATARTPNISAALLAGGYARNYSGGRRNSWCAGPGG
jgi:endonuclease YncB( thermonuclease family)